MFDRSFQATKEGGGEREWQEREGIPWEGRDDGKGNQRKRADCKKVYKINFK